MPDEIAETLAQQASGMCNEIEAVAPDEGAALALYGRAATLSLWAAMACVDVRMLDRVIDIGFYLMIAAGRNPNRLFPPATTLLETMTFMAWCHMERFVYRLDVFDLDEAERYAGDALTLGERQDVPEPTTIRAETVIACVRERRYQLGGSAVLLDQAIARLEHVISLLPDINATVSLASCLRQRAEFVGGEKALQDLREAGRFLADLVDVNSDIPQILVLPLLRTRWLAELALVHWAASRLFENVAELERAKELCREALEEWPQSSEARLANAIVHRSARYYIEVLQLGKRPNNTWISLQAAEALAELTVASGSAADTVGSAGIAWKILQQAIDNQINDESKILWLPRLSAVTTVAVPAQAYKGDVASAIDRAENIRTRILQESFPDEDNELLDLGAAGHKELCASIRHALSLRRNREAPARSRAKARDVLWADVEKVRQLPGFSAFWTNPKAIDVAAVLEAPAIYLVPGEPEGVALVIYPGKEVPTAVRLPGCPRTPPPVVERFRQAAFSGNLPAGARRTAINALSTWAWDAVYKPLADVLAGQPHAHLIGLSYLMLVPFHAARQTAREGWHYAIEEIEFRYVPSARALMSAKRRQTPDVEPRFMLIPQPIRGEAERLQGARSEADAICAYFKAPVVLDERNVTQNEVREAIGSVGWLHAACHGIADPEEPLASGLLLEGDERFSLRDLFEVKPRHLLLTVLSACQTNVPDVRLPDEAASVAAGLLIGGCRAVVASAWQVPDAATSALMQLFYRKWRLEGYDVPAALRQAQLAFAKGGANVKGWRDGWSDPYFWAGFSYLGP